MGCRHRDCRHADRDKQRPRNTKIVATVKALPSVLTHSLEVRPSAPGETRGYRAARAAPHEPRRTSRAARLQAPQCPCNNCGALLFMPPLHQANPRTAGDPLSRSQRIFCIERPGWHGFPTAQPPVLLGPRQNGWAPLAKTPHCKILGSRRMASGLDGPSRRRRRCLSRRRIEPPLSGEKKANGARIEPVPLAFRSIWSRPSKSAADHAPSFR